VSCDQRLELEITALVQTGTAVVGVCIAARKQVGMLTEHNRSVFLRLIAALTGLYRVEMSICGGRICSLTGMDGFTRDVQSPDPDFVSYTLACYEVGVGVEREDQLSRLIDKQHLQNHPDTRGKAKNG
jgi:hypothetical protein